MSKTLKTENDSLKLENETLKRKYDSLTLDNESLKLDNESLKLVNENLNYEIKQLNENTVIESMNDMKVQLQELEDNSVQLNIYSSLKNSYKQCYNVSVSANNINDIIIEELELILHNDFTEGYKNDIIESTINNLSLVNKIINNHEEWNENICHCDI